jgi:periplasmic divalent cation tolerance protein
MTRIVEIVTTVANERDAERLARALVETRRAACVSFDAVRSLFRWEGAISDETEVRLTIKTVAHRAAEVERWLSEQHPYDTPAIVRIAVTGVNDAYAAWVEASVDEPEAS